MKNSYISNLFIVISFLLTITSASSQDFLSVLKVWSYDGDSPTGGLGEIGGTTAFAFTEDSVLVDGQYYRSFLSMWDGTFPNPEQFGENISIFVREDNDGKVYFKYNEEPEVMTYDFSLSVGESFINVQQLYPLLTINSELQTIDTIYDYLNQPRKRYVFDNEIWIEGIGKTYSFMQTFNAANNWGYPLLCYKEEGYDIIYPSGIIDPSGPECAYIPVHTEDFIKVDFFNVFPNPAQDIIQLESSFDFEKEDIQILNILGEKISFDMINNQRIDSSTWPKGLYFITLEMNDKKVTKRLLKL